MADETTTTETKLDMARVQRWAELLDGDSQARDYMRERLAGGELEQLSVLSLRSRRLELALQHGIPAQLAEVHLTASDPQLLEQQAESLKLLLEGAGPRVRPEPGRAQGRPPSSDVSPLPVYEAAPVNRDEWLESQFVRLYEH